MGQRIRGPGSLYIRAQGLSQRELLPRMPNESPKRHKDMAEDDLMLSTSQNAWRKGQTQCRGRTREKAANIVIQNPASDSPYSKPCYLTFPTAPNHSRYGLTGQVCTPESKTYTWTLKGKRNTSIKEKESEGERDPPEGGKNPKKREKGKDTMPLGRCPRT